MKRSKGKRTLNNAIIRTIDGSEFISDQSDETTVITTPHADQRKKFDNMYVALQYARHHGLLNSKWYIVQIGNN